ncbi:MAG: hypothetical protein WBF33_03830 [Candidatus Nitrosopolaris sp.]|jgi:hypothetical protein
MDLPTCCRINPFALETLVEKDFLLKQSESEQEQFRVRHERYATEFLVQLYNKHYRHNADWFDQTFGIKNMIKCIWDKKLNTQLKNLPNRDSILWIVHQN